MVDRPHPNPSPKEKGKKKVDVYTKLYEAFVLKSSPLERI